MRTATLVILGLVLCAYTANATVAASGGDCSTNTCPANEYCKDLSTDTCTACPAGTDRATAQSTAGAEAETVCTTCGAYWSTAGSACNTNCGNIKK